MGYNIAMLADAFTFLLRICLVVVIWLAVWRLIQPRTRMLRILRAALLALAMLAILALVKITTG